MFILYPPGLCACTIPSNTLPWLGTTLASKLTLHASWCSFWKATSLLGARLAAEFLNYYDSRAITRIISTFNPLPSSWKQAAQRSEEQQPPKVVLVTGSWKHQANILEYAVYIIFQFTFELEYTVCKPYRISCIGRILWATSCFQRCLVYPGLPCYFCHWQSSSR